MRFGVTLFASTTTPRCACHDSTTCAGVIPSSFAAALTSGTFRLALTWSFDPKGE